MDREAPSLLLSLPPSPSSSPPPCQPSNVGITDSAVGGGGEEDNLLESPPPLTLDILPDEILGHVFRMLPIRERGRLAKTCRKMNTIMNSTSVWSNVSVRLTGIDKCLSWFRADQMMIQHCEEHFRNVEVVLISLDLTALSMNKVHSFAERGVLKRVNLVAASRNSMIDIFKEPSSIIKKRAKNWRGPRRRSPRFNPYEPQDANGNICHCPESVQPTSIERAKMMELLTTNTRVTLQVYSCRVFGDTLKSFYSATNKSKTICQSVSTLILPEIWYEYALSEVCPRGSLTPTAVLVSDFPNLQKLQLSLHNLSEELLLELSNTSGERSQLKKLILLHKDYRVDMGMWFPSLSSSSWCQLTSACPELTVECRVTVLNEQFPPLTDPIKAETPLVRLEVTAHKDDIRNSDSVQSMQELCREHKCPFVFVP